MEEVKEELKKEKKGLFSKGDDGLPDWMQFIITGGVFGLFFWILSLLFHPVLELDPTHRDLLNIILGSFIASFGKVIDFWFRQNKPEEGKKSGGQ